MVLVQGILFPQIHLFLLLQIPPLWIQCLLQRKREGAVSGLWVVVGDAVDVWLRNSGWIGRSQNAYLVDLISTSIHSSRVSDPVLPFIGSSPS